jgi:hypothetical protein
MGFGDCQERCLCGCENSWIVRWGILSGKEDIF